MTQLLCYEAPMLCYKPSGRQDEMTIEHFFNQEALHGYIPTDYKAWCRWWKNHMPYNHYLLPYFHRHHIWCPLSNIYKESVMVVDLYGLKQFYKNGVMIRCVFVNGTHLDLPISKSTMYMLIEQVTLILEGFKHVGGIPWVLTEEWQCDNPYLNIERYLKRKNRRDATMRKLEIIYQAFTLPNMMDLLNESKLFKNRGGKLTSCYKKEALSQNGGSAFVVTEKLIDFESCLLIDGVLYKIGDLSNDGVLKIGRMIPCGECRNE